MKKLLRHWDGNFTECGNPSQPGIKPITDYLASLHRHIDANCQPGHFYLVNNDSPGFLPDGGGRRRNFQWRLYSAG